MSITAVKTSSVAYSGDAAQAGTGVTTSSTNSDAPMIGAMLVNLTAIFNPITVPTGHTIYGVDITPATGNTASLTLKGITSDTGIPMHPTKTTSLAFASSTPTFGITSNGVTTVTLSYW